MAFETYPNYNIRLPEVPRPMAPTPIPVYDTSQSIKQLQMLSEYFSPLARAQRAAAVAKANWEYRVYHSNNPAAMLNPMFGPTLRAMQTTEELRRAQIERTHLQTQRMTPGAILPPQVLDGYSKLGVQPTRTDSSFPTSTDDTSTDIDSTPPPIGSSTIPDVPNSSIPSS
jgi:hypothetical protein